MTNPSSPAPPRTRSRLQFSLRMLLLLMALVGVGLTVYRWPFVETKESDNHVIGGGVWHVHRLDRTSYRRSWRIEPLKHGPDQILLNGQVRYEAHYYDGQLHGPRRVLNKEGQLLVEGNYRNGMLHGPFRTGDGPTWVWQGTFERDEPHGEWRGMVNRQVLHPSPSDYTTFFYKEGRFNDSYWNEVPADPVLVISHWNRGKRHGLWTWKTLTGETLCTANYARNNLVCWNDEPVVEQLLNWLSSPQVNDLGLVRFLAEAKGGQWSRLYFRYDRMDFRLTTDGPREIGCSIHGVHDNRLRAQTESDTLASVLCEKAILDGCAFDYRYGGLWLVPREDPEPPFVDPTGVTQIEFEPGSPQARDWNEVIDVMSLDVRGATAARTITHLLAGSSLESNTFPLEDSATQLDTSLPPQRLFTRKRRDALGLVLYQTGCQVERSGNTLIFKPRPGRTSEQRECRPLAPPVVDPFG